MSDIEADVLRGCLLVSRALGDGGVQFNNRTAAMAVLMTGFAMLATDEKADLLPGLDREALMATAKECMELMISVSGTQVVRS